MIRPSKTPPHNSNAGQYVACGSNTLALNYKAASTALVRAIIARHHPELVQQAAAAHRPHRLLAKVKPERPVIIVRDPIDRFKSACVQTSKTPADALQEIKSLPVYNVHFWPTSRLLVYGCRLYRFDKHLSAAASALGIVLEVANKSEGRKPRLKKGQRAELERIFARDIELYESIKEAGQLWPESAAAKEFNATMSRAFPEHLHGTASGCCDSMADGHGQR